MKGEMNDSTSQLGEWFAPEIDQVDGSGILRSLLTAAWKALHAEDTTLQETFKNVGPALQARYRQGPTPASEGLGYWLFETTLVYHIFKAWIPVAHTIWEAVYRGRPRDRIDLLVHPDDGDTNVWGFEAKWWQSLQRKSVSAVMGDAGKLLNAAELRQRFLLTFWFSRVSAREKDFEEVKQTCKAAQVPGHRRAMLEPVYLGTFPTLIAGDVPHYFALCALRVSTP